MVNNKQTGVALLVLVIIIALTFSAYYFSSISVVEIKTNNIEQTRAALKQAKQMLINYAVMHADGISGGDAGEFGYLPCPHINSGGLAEEGEQQLPSCGGGKLNSIGYYPWKTLGVGALRDGSGNCLWYAVSAGYKNSVYSGLINEDTNGMFQVVDGSGIPIAGNAPEDRIVAVVFAPGSALGTQTRVFDNATFCGEDGGNPQSYLDFNINTNNATLVGAVDELDQFVHANLTSDTEALPYNDQFITITREEIWSAIVTRNDFNNKMTDLTEVLAMCLKQYAVISTKDRLPWPAPMNLTDYRVDSNYDDASGYAGRFPFKVTDSNNAITVGSNDELFTQGACDITGGLTVDLIIDPGPPKIISEYRVLWNNWKDHFFYVLSKDFEPAVTTASCGSNCITVNTVPMAGVVIYAGSRQGGQIRNSAVVAGDVDTKSDISNYIDDAANLTAFTTATGKGAYVTIGVNDIMYCIKPDLTVVSC